MSVVMIFSFINQTGIKRDDTIDTWSSGMGECDEICYKDPVFKDHQWSAYIDRSPGAASYSEVFSISSIITTFGY